MNHENPFSSTLERGATAVITHRVRDGQQDGYDAWLNEIGPLCRSYRGHLDLQIIRPIPGLTATYTVIIRFDTREHLHGWMSSQDRKRLIEQVRPLLAQDDDFFIRSGLDFWFTPEGGREGEGTCPLETISRDMVRPLSVGACHSAGRRIGAAATGSTSKSLSGLAA